MPRETPRPVYLPNTPKFIFGADNTELLLSLPSTLWDYAMQSTGGSIEGDSGRRAAFIIRRDELITFTLRFFESEWVAIQHFLDHVQDGKPFTWIPDQLDQTTSYDIQLVHPAVGEKYEAVPNPDYPLVQMLTLTVMKGAQITTLSVATDALVRGKLVWMDHYSAGKAQSVGDDGSTIDHKIGRYRERSPETDYVYSPTGGHVGGGYIEAINDTFLDTFLFNIGVSSGPPLSGDYVDSPSQNSLFTLHDLNGVVLTEPKRLQSFGQHSAIYVNPDYTLQAYRSIGSNTWAPMGSASTNTVPPRGVFGLETQAGATPVGYRVGGFVLTRAYSDSWPVEGKSMIHLLGNPNEIVSTNFPYTPIIGIPAGTRLHGSGVIGPYGDTPRWQYDLSFAPAMPKADSHVGSIIGYTHEETFGLDSGFAGQGISTVLLWGQTDRWRNVISKTRTLDEHVEQLMEAWPMGNLSPATNRWLDGAPFVPFGDPVVRNTLLNNAQEFYRVGLDQVTAPIADIVALGPFAMYGARMIHGQYINNFPGFLAPVEYLPWLFTGPSYVAADYPDGPGRAHHTFRVALKTRDSGVTLKGRMGQASLDVTGRDPGTCGWRVFWGFQINPPTLWHVDDANKPWSKDNLPDVGVINDFSKLDALVDLDPALRWLLNDFAQVGLDVAFHTRPAPITHFAQQHPVADLWMFGTGTNTTTGFLRAYDLSIDFNGTKDELISGIVVRSLNWGDGSPPIALTGGGPTHSATHTYAGPGNYTVTLTVTNALGLTSTVSFVWSALGILTADLSAVIDSIGDPTGKTVNFTDLSSITLGSIVSRTWDFGDGATSTATNPTHVYAAYDTYTVTLDAVDDSGRHAIDSVNVEVTEPVTGGGGCGLTADAKTNPATAGIQADDFAGGNARFPNYLSSTTLRTYLVDRVPYRALYNFLYTHDDAEIELDTVNTFNGRPSLKIGIHGDSYGGWDSEFSDDTTNLGDDSNFDNDRPDEIWIRIIFKLDTLLRSVANAIDPSSTDGLGLQLAAIGGPGNYSPILFGNGGRAYQQVQTRSVESGGETTREIVDLGAQSVIDSGDWAELIAYAKYNSVAHTQRNMTWIGAACSLAGVSPLCDRSNPSFPAVSGGGFTLAPLFESVDWMYYYNAGSTVFSDPKPAVNVSLVQIHRVPLLTNPFGVALT